MTTPYAYIKQAYGLSFAAGQNVTHTVTRKGGTVTRENPSAGHYVMVRFDGSKHSLPCHPEELGQSYSPTHTGAGESPEQRCTTDAN